MCIERCGGWQEAAGAALTTLVSAYTTAKNAAIAAVAATASKDDSLENLTDAMKSDIRDADEFLPLAAQIPVVPEVEEFRLEQANEALIFLKQSKIHAASVLKVQQ